MRHQINRHAWICLLVFAIAGPASAADKRPERITGERAILKALDQKVSLNFSDHPLRVVVGYLRARYGIEAQLDKEALRRESVHDDTPITLRVENVKLRSALNLLLRDLDFTWIIADEVLLITSDELAEQQLFTRVYDLGSMVTVYHPDGRPWQNFDALTFALMDTIEPMSWEDRGGPGTVRGMTLRGANVLVIRQTRRVHEEIERLLEQLTMIADRYDDVFPTGRPKAPGSEMPRWMRWSGSPKPDGEQ
jgi:hypothetical protein